MNSAGYWISYSSTAMALQEETSKLEGKTGVEESARFDVWAMMAVRYGLRVVGLRVKFYKSSAKDTMHARLVMQCSKVKTMPPLQTTWMTSWKSLTCTWPPN
jgi:hypothetical protein